jgi:hypothetical protein
MFHVLIQDEILLAKGNSITNKGDATPIFCKTETPRAAISLARFKMLVGGKKLNDKRCCKNCYAAAMRKVGRSIQRASEETADPAN